MKAERQMSESSVRWFRRPTTSQVPITAAADDSLDAFRSESDKKAPSEGPSTEKTNSARNLVLIGIATFVGGATAAGGTLFLRANTRPLNASQTAQVTFETRPPGAAVIIDGASRGNTPLIVQLSSGHHAVAIRKDGEERAVPLDLTAGTSVIQHFEFADQPAAPPAAATGKLTVSTDPAGARVLIDDKLAGVSPLTIDLVPATHKVVVSNERGAAERSMLVEAGGVNAMMFSLPRAVVPETGWLALSAPFEVQVIEHNEIIGTTAATKLMMATGAHNVDLVNDTLGYRDQRRIQIDPGKTTSLLLDAKSSLSLNARPWAEVTIDGRPAGQTPIANASVSLGSHQIVFRHPNLGERRQSVVVTARGPNRIGVDMTQ